MVWTILIILLIVILVTAAIVLFVLLAKRDLPGSVRVKSYSGSGSYKVNPSAVTCSCPDFHKRRKTFDTDDPRRLCKHLIGVLDAQGAPEELLKYEEGLSFWASRRIGFPVCKRKSVQIGGREVEAFLPEEGYEWAGIYTDGRAYALHVQRYYWARNEEPFGADEIARVLFGKPAPLPKSVVITTSGREPSPDHPGWVASGLLEGVALEADINPRAKWMRVYYDGDEIASCNVATGDVRIEPRLDHMQGVLLRWTKEEYAACRAKGSEASTKARKSD